MPLREIKKYEVTCEHCHATIVFNGYNEADRPEGWGTIRHDDCGLTGYTRWADACPDCIAKIPKSRTRF